VNMKRLLLATATFTALGLAAFAPVAAAGELPAGTVVTTETKGITGASSVHVVVKNADGSGMAPGTSPLGNVRFYTTFLEATDTVIVTRQPNGRRTKTRTHKEAFTMFFDAAFDCPVATGLGEDCVKVSISSSSAVGTNVKYSRAAKTVTLSGTVDFRTSADTTPVDTQKINITISLASIVPTKTESEYTLNPDATTVTRVESERTTFGGAPATGTIGTQILDPQSDGRIDRVKEESTTRYS
jgi:hypothetical protein